MRGIDQQMTTFRQTKDADTAETRAAMLKKLQQHGDRLVHLREAFPNSTSWVSRFGLGSQERANLAQTLATVGKAGLANFATQAQLSGNKVLAAAVVDAIEAMPARDRPFMAIAFADKFVGDEHKEWREAIDVSLDKVETAFELDRVFTKGGELPLDKIARGTRKRQLAA